MKQTETSHFWVGTFKDEETFFEFMGENEAYYSDADDDSDDSDETYISEFAKSQSETWYNHDFLECGFEEDLGTYSYSDQWLEELHRRIEKLGIKEINGLVMVSESEISNPSPVKLEGISLAYLGTITYNL